MLSSLLLHVAARAVQSVQAAFGTAWTAQRSAVAYWALSNAAQSCWPARGVSPTTSHGKLCLTKLCMKNCTGSGLLCSQRLQQHEERRICKSTGLAWRRLTETAAMGHSATQRRPYTKTLRSFEIFSSRRPTRSLRQRLASTCSAGWPAAVDRAWAPRRLLPAQQQKKKRWVAPQLLLWPWARVRSRARPPALPPR